MTVANFEPGKCACNSRKVTPSSGISNPHLLFCREAAQASSPALALALALAVILHHLHHCPLGHAVALAETLAPIVGNFLLDCEGRGASWWNFSIDIFDEPCSLFGTFHSDDSCGIRLVLLYRENCTR